MTNFISPVSWGLGDLIVSLPAVQGLIAGGDRTWLVSRSDLQVGLAERIPGLAGTVAEAELSTRFKPNTDIYYNLRQHPIQTNYWWGSPEFARDFDGYRINDILELVCRDLRIPADFRMLVPLACRLRPELSGTIVFLPGSDGSYKCWPREHWLTLRDALRRQQMDCVIIGQPDKSKEVSALVESGMSWLPTPSLTDALDVLSSSRAVVGVDTGLMHLAVHQGRPTIALFRQDPIYRRDYTHAAALIGSPCTHECINRSLTCTNNGLTELSGWTPTTWSCAVSGAERCMAGITPDRVLSLLTDFLGDDKGKIAQSIPGRGHGPSG